MQVKKAEFVKSSTREEDCPDPGIPEYAFIGRSNVGKSSLINLLTSRRNLAKTSSTPGKTQLINHFIVNDDWYLVDLPGYGWARVSKTAKADWKKMIEDYLLNRRNLACVFVLVDIRHEAQKIDIEFINWLGEEGIPFVLVFTKKDKLSKTKIDSNLAAYRRVLRQDWEDIPQEFLTSAQAGEGKGEILDFIDSINKSMNQ